MAGRFLTCRVLVPLVLSVVGCHAARDGTDSQALATESAENDMANPFFILTGKFENVWKQKGQQDKAAEVNNLQYVKQQALRKTFASTQPGGTDVASRDVHVAIATEMLDNLKQATAQIMDLGCGTGALLAIFLELVAPNCDGCKVEGIEYEAGALQKALKWLPFSMKFPLFSQEVKDKLPKVPLDVRQGDAFTWNTDSRQNGQYHVINVGFALTRTTFDGTKWKNALADGGKLIVPLCTTIPPQLDDKGRCTAKFHVFSPTSEEVLDVEIQFVCVGCAI